MAIVLALFYLGILGLVLGAGYKLYKTKCGKQFDESDFDESQTQYIEDKPKKRKVTKKKSAKRKKSVSKYSRK